MRGIISTRGSRICRGILLVVLNNVVSWEKTCSETTHSQRTLQRRHNEPDGVSNRRSFHCLLNCRFSCRSKKTSKLRVTGLCAGNSPVTGEFPAQKQVMRKMFPFYKVIMNVCTGVSIVCSTVCPGTDQRKHQSSAPLALVSWIHWWPVDSPHKALVTRKKFHLMTSLCICCEHYISWWCTVRYYDFCGPSRDQARFLYKYYTGREG